jgi:hypothetical protein
MIRQGATLSSRFTFPIAAYCPHAFGLQALLDGLEARLEAADA